MPENQVIYSKHRKLQLVDLNSKGQIPWSAYLHDRISILNRSGDIETFCQFRQATSNPQGNYQGVEALAIDRHDNVFVIVMFKDCTSKKYLYVLFVFDSSGNEQCERVLDFLEDGARKFVVNNDGDIIIQAGWENLCVCDGNGNLKSRLLMSEWCTDLKCVTDQNEIVMHKHSHVLVYTKKGELKRTITVKNKIKSVTFNSVTSKIEVLVKNFKSVLRWPSYSILSYSENDEVECLYLPVKKHGRWSRFLLHPAGPAAFVYYDSDIKTFKVVFM